MILKNIPNILTLTRLLLIMPFLIFFYQQNYLYAFYIFLLAGFTDALDGWIARFFHWQSSFGSLIDPLADKLLITSSMIALALIGTLPWWFVILVFLRDFTISCGVLAWYEIVPSKLEFKPTYLSKINTVLQLSLIILSLFTQAYPYNIPHLNHVLLYLTTGTTAASYIDYVWKWSKKAYHNTHSSHSS